MNLPLLPADKANHALYGALIFIFVAWLCTELGHPHQARQAGVAAAVLVGCIKELIDWLANRRAVAAGLPPPHGVEARDVVATVGGSLICLAATLAVRN
ncbi:MAG: hypothetical protein ABI433_00990 [Burkholderiaceae bacterium]